MTNKITQIYAPIPDNIRARLLSTFQPTLLNIWARQVTWAYGDTENTWYPDREARFWVTGRHTGPTHEALTGHLIVVQDGRTVRHETRPNRNPLHITLSTDKGVRPAVAGQIDPSRVVTVEPAARQSR
jgi:hypothetical protein